MPIFVLVIPLLLAAVVIVGALMLRAAVSLANKMLPSERREPSQTQDELPIEYTPSAPSNDINPFAAPNFIEDPVPLTDVIVPAIPEPNFGRACGIVSATAVTIFVAMIATSELGLLRLDIGPAINLLLSFSISLFIYSLMLPTTFARAALLCVLTVVISLAISISIGAVVAFAIYS